MWRPWEVAECVPLDYTIVRVVVFITPIIQYSNTPILRVKERTMNGRASFSDHARRRWFSEMNTVEKRERY